MKTTKTNPAKLLLRYLWPRMQRGERHFIIDDTQLAFSMTAQQLSKVVRRFNETGHELNWPGFHFSAKVLDIYRLVLPPGFDTYEEVQKQLKGQI